MRIEPFEPPRLWTAPGREALWNALLSHAGAALPLPRRGTALRFAPTPPPPAAGWALTLLPDQAPPLIAVVHDFPFRHLFGAELDAADLPDLPAALRESLAEGMVALLGDALPPALIGALRVTGSGPAGELAGRMGAASLEWFGVEIDGLAPEPVRLTIGCARDAVLARLLSLEPAARPVRSALAGRLTARLHLTLGALLLTRAELRSTLVPGAVAVFPAAREGEITLRSDAALYRFGRSEAGWQCRAREPRAQGRHRPAIASSEPEREPAMPSDQISDERSSQPAEGWPLRVGVDFDLGSVDVPLAEIESWQPGAVVPLDPPVPGRGIEVTIRVNGLVIGSGDLVAIDTRPAVRIARLALEG